MQRGLTVIELMICISILGILASEAILTLGQSLAQQEMIGASLQLAGDIRYLQQLAVNAGSETTSSILLFTYDEPYGYMITSNTKVIKRIIFPPSIKLYGPYSPIGFGLSGAPLSGAQTIGLQSSKLKTWKYVILAPVTGRVRISDTLPLRPEE